MKHTILVTGATGFIGSNLVKELVHQQQTVKILVRKNSQHPFITGLPVERIEGDINDINRLQIACAGCDTIFHLAARISFNQQDYAQTYQTNVLGTRHLLHAALMQGIKKVVHVSSAAALGLPNSSQKLLTEDNIFPETQKRAGYPYSKWLAEQEILPFINKGLPVSIANLSTVYGAGDLGFNAGAIIRLLYNYPVIFAPPGGCSTITVNDVVTGLLAVAQRGRPGERYILTSENKTYQEVFDTIAQVVKNKRITKVIPPISHTPLRLTARIVELISTKLNIPSKLLTEDVVDSIFFYRYLDNRKAKNELGWKPRIDFRTAVQETFDFYRAQKRL